MGMGMGGIIPDCFPNSLNGGGSLSVRFVMADGDGDGDGEGGRGGGWGWGWGWGKGRGMCFEDATDVVTDVVAQFRRRRETEAKK